MSTRCQNRSPGTFKNHCFSLKGVQISLLAGVPTMYEKYVRNISQNDAKIDEMGYWECRGKSWKTVPEKYAKVKKMGCQTDAKSEEKSIKKGS